MADVLCVGGPLNGQTIATDAAAVNVIDDSQLGQMLLVTYRCDQVAGTARVVGSAVV